MKNILKRVVLVSVLSFVFILAVACGLNKTVDKVTITKGGTAVGATLNHDIKDRNNTITFAATVEITGTKGKDPVKTVTWSVDTGNTAGASISDAGVLTIATVGSVTVTATSTANTEKKASVAITVVDSTKLKVVDAAQGWEGENDKFVITVPKAGDILLARIFDNGTAVTSLTDYTFAWILGDDQVLGTEERVTLTIDNIGITLRVEVKFKGNLYGTVNLGVIASNYSAKIVDSAQGWEGENNEFVINNPKAGNVLLARVFDNGTAVTSLTDYTFAWILGDDQVLGTQERVTLTADNVGKTLSVKISFKGKLVCTVNVGIIKAA